MKNDIVKNASQYYQMNYAENEDADLIEYFNSRKISPSTAKKFGVGIAPTKVGLIEYLTDINYTTDEMAKFGLIRELGGLWVDIMSKRVIVEIRNVYGDIVGFGGRIIKGDKKYKYMNTPTTPLFTKKLTVFNLDKAKYAIDYSTENSDFVLLVEGYFDVMTLYDKGIENVVCTMGTALTDTQAKLIKMFTNNVVVCYDGDEAGQRATEKAKKIFEKNNMACKTITLTDGLDPDEYVLANGKDKFLELIKK